MNHELDIFDLQARLCPSLGHTIRLRIIHTIKEGPKLVKVCKMMRGILEAREVQQLDLLHCIQG